MNSGAHKTIFSKRLGTLVAVSEHASRQGKATGATGFGGMAARGWNGHGMRDCFAPVVLGAALVGMAWAQTPPPGMLPAGGQVSAGSASISTAGTAMAIDQTSQRAAINWQSFNIGSNASVTVNQPSASAVLLNRIGGEAPSQILGRLSANGQIVLVNPNGITFGKDGSVSAASITASTLNISDADFMAGNMRFTRNGATGSIVNQGQLRTTPGGYVALLGATVNNQGSISTPQGNTYLAAAEAVKMPVTGSGRIQLELSPAAVSAAVSNSGTIVTEGGQVFMQASTAAGVMATVLQSGRIDTTGEQGGKVTLQADDGHVRVSGTITANSTGKDEQNQPRKGGDIVIGRDEVTGALAAVGDASGAQLESQGGFIETSGKHIALEGVQIKATKWLIDPVDIEINNSGTRTQTTYSQISNQTINAALNAGTSVTVTTAGATGSSSAGGLTAGTSTGGNILLSGAISKTGGGTASLSLTADNNITLNQGISSSAGALNLNLTASAGSISGTGNIAINGGNLALHNVNSSATGVLSGVISGTGTSLTKTGAGLVTLTGANTYTGATTVSAGTLQVGNGAASGQLGDNGTVFSAVSVASGANLTFFRSGTLQLRNAISGAGTISFTGVNLAGQSIYVVGGNNSSLSGTINATGSRLQVSNSNQLGTAAINVSNGGTLFVNGITTVSNALSLGGMGWEDGSGFGRLGALRLTGATYSGSITLTSSTSIGAVGSSGIVSGVISGPASAGLQINAASGLTGGNVYFTNTNTYSGTTTIGSGILQLGASGTTGTLGSGAVVNNGTLYFNRSNAMTVANAISGSGTVFQIGSGTTTLTGTNTYTGATTISAGTLQVGNAGSTGTLGTGAVSVASGSTLGFNRSDSGLVVSNTISGAGTVWQYGTGRTTLTGANSYSGITRVTQGTLTVGNGTSGAIGTGAIEIDGTNTTLQFVNAGSNAVNLSAGQTVTGNGTIVADRAMVFGGAIRINRSAADGHSNLTLRTTSVDNTLAANGLGINLNAGVQQTGTDNVSLTVDSFSSVNSNSTGTIGVTGAGFGKLDVNMTARGNVAAAQNANSYGLSLNKMINANGGTVTLAGTQNNSNAATGSWSAVTFGTGSGISADSFTVTGTQNSGNVGANRTGIVFNGTTNFTSTGSGISRFNGTTNTGNFFMGLGVYTTGTMNLDAGSNGGQIVMAGANLAALGQGTRSEANINTRGNVTLGSSSYGYLHRQGTITAATGTLNLTGTEFSSYNSVAAIRGTDGTTINVSAPSVTIGSGPLPSEGGPSIGLASGSAGFSLNLVANNLIVNTNASNAPPVTISTGTGTTSIRNFSGGTLINVGGADAAASGGSPATLGLTNAELNTITAARTVIGSSNAGTLTVSAATTTNNATGDISLISGENIAVNSALNVGNRTLTLDAQGVASTVTQTAAITANSLALLGSNAAFSLNNSNNSVNTLAGSARSVIYTDSDALTIGTVGSTAGLTATGTIHVAAGATGNGNLTVTQAVSTTDTSTAALTLNAGMFQSAGTAAGGDILVSGSGSLATGAGGRATLYTGSVSGSTALASLLGSGTGRFRYNSDEGTTRYSAALGSGLHAIYRESPSLTLSTGSTMTYGDALPSTLGVATGLVNGDTLSYSVLNRLNSATGHIRAGSYNIGTNAASLGYTMGSSTALLVVSPKSASATAAATSTTYTGLLQTQAAATTSGFISGDAITISGLASGTNAGTYASSLSVGGADASNYSVSITNANLTIGKANLSLAMADQTKTYDGTTTATLASGAITATGVTVNGVTQTATVTQSIGSYNSKNVANATTVTATLSSSDFIASSGTDLSNYNLPTSVSGSGTITPKSVTYSGLSVSSKTYDQSTSANLSGTAALASVAAGSSLSSDGKVIASDSVTLAGTAVGTYASKDVAATNNTVTFSGLSLSGADAGNYTLAQQAAINGSGTITARTITPTVLANDKTYDGNASATLSSSIASAGVYSGDAVSFSSTAANFADRHVAKDGNGNVLAKTVTVSGLSLSGADASNYALASTSATTTATITPKTLTLAAGSVSKTYDGGTGYTTQAADLSALSNQLVGGDSVTAATIRYANRNAGAGNKTVTLDAVTVSDGNSGNNYSLTLAGNSTSTITPKALTLSAGSVSKTYDGGTGYTTQAADLSALSSQLVGGDSVTAATIRYADRNAGTGSKAVTLDAVTVSDGNSGNNYSLSLAGNSTSTIAPRALTASLVGSVGKTYDGNTHASLSASHFQLGGFVSGEGAAVTQTTGAYASPNVNANGGTGLVSASLLPSHFSAGPGTLLSNYTLPTTASGNVGTISPAALTLKVGNTTAFVTQDARTAFDTGLSYSGLQGTDTIASALVQVPTASDRTYIGSTFTPAVGRHSAVYGLGFTPAAQNGNYSITVQSGDLQVIPADKLLIHIAGQTDTYGNRSASNAGQAAGVSAQYCLVASNCNGANLYNLSLSAGAGNRWVGTDNTNTTITFDTVVNTAGQLSGGGFLKAGNHSWDVLNLSASNSGQFNGHVVNSGTLALGRLALTPTANAVSKTYDGTASAAGVALVTAQAKAGDAVSAVAGSGSYSTRNVVNNDTVTFDNLSLQGADSSNYVLTAVSVQGAGSITPRALTLSASPDTKTYDGSTLSAGLVVANGLVGADTAVATQSFVSKNVLGRDGSTLQVNRDFTVNDGNGGRNYSVITRTASGTISPRPASVIVNGARRSFNGLPQSLDPAWTSGFLSGDAIVVHGLATGIAPGLYSSSLSVGGADASNYSVTYQNAVLEILPVPSAQNTRPMPLSREVRPETRIAYHGFVAKGSASAAVASDASAQSSASCSADSMVNCQCSFNAGLGMEVCTPGQPDRSRD